ncbi:unnamed protein product [Prunus brigantina]
MCTEHKIARRLRFFVAQSHPDLSFSPLNTWSRIHLKYFARRCFSVRRANSNKVSETTRAPHSSPQISISLSPPSPQPTAFKPRSFLAVTPELPRPSPSSLQPKIARFSLNLRRLRSLSFGRQFRQFSYGF